MSNLTQLRSFYDTSTPIYEIFAYTKKALSIHYGFWEKGTKSIEQAMHNEDSAVIKAGKISSTSRVLDAGCGVGGSAIYIAQTTKSHVTGITLSQRQAHLAQRYSHKHGVGTKTKFEVVNYYHTPYPDGCFDVIYGIESICYAQPKTRFFKEAYRLLKPGGKLIISDGFKKRHPANPRENKVYQNFLYGYSLEKLDSIKTVTLALNNSGFISVKSFPKLKQVYPSVRYYYFLSLIFLPLAYLLKSFHPSLLAMYRNGLAAISAYQGIKLGIADYALILATKPTKSVVLVS